MERGGAKDGLAKVVEKMVVENMVMVMVVETMVMVMGKCGDGDEKDGGGKDDDGDVHEGNPKGLPFQNDPTPTRQRLVDRGVAADALVPTWCDQHQVKMMLMVVMVVVVVVAVVVVVRSTSGEDRW